MPINRNMNNLTRKPNLVNNVPRQGGIPNLTLSGCNICGQSHNTEVCPYLSDVKHVQDSETPTRARLTLPSDLEIVKKNNEQISILACTNFPRGTQFGPFQAPRCINKPDNVKFLLKIFGKPGEESYFLDTKNEDACNWMCLVLAALTAEEQNLICYQMRDDIYFTVLKEIKAGDELKVWYAPYYAIKMGCLPYASDIFVAKKKAMENKETPEVKGSKRRKRPKEKIKKNCNAILLDSEVTQKLAQQLPAQQLGARHSPEKWKCKECGSEEKSVVMFAKHLMKHFKTSCLDNDKPISCQICSETFTSEKMLVRHKVIKHGTIVKRVSLLAKIKDDDLQNVTGGITDKPGKDVESEDGCADSKSFLISPTNLETITNGTRDELKFLSENKSEMTLNFNNINKEIDMNLLQDKNLVSVDLDGKNVQADKLNSFSSIVHNLPRLMASSSHSVDEADITNLNCSKTIQLEPPLNSIPYFATTSQLTAESIPEQQCESLDALLEQLQRESSTTVDGSQLLTSIVENNVFSENIPKSNEPPGESLNNESEKPNGTFQETTSLMENGTSLNNLNTPVSINLSEFDAKADSKQPSNKNCETDIDHAPDLDKTDYEYVVIPLQGSSVANDSLKTIDGENMEQNSDRSVNSKLHLEETLPSLSTIILSGVNNYQSVNTIDLPNSEVKHINDQDVSDNQNMVSKIVQNVGNMLGLDLGLVMNSCRSGSSLMGTAAGGRIAEGTGNEPVISAGNISGNYDHGETTFTFNVDGVPVFATTAMEVLEDNIENKMESGEAVITNSGDVQLSIDNANGLEGQQQVVTISFSINDANILMADGGPSNIDSLSVDAFSQSKPADFSDSSKLPEEKVHETQISEHMQIKNCNFTIAESHKSNKNINSYNILSSENSFKTDITGNKEPNCFSAEKESNEMAACAKSLHSKGLDVGQQNCDNFLEVLSTQSGIRNNISLERSEFEVTSENLKTQDDKTKNVNTSHSSAKDMNKNTLRIMNNNIEVFEMSTSQSILDSVLDMEVLPVNSLNSFSGNISKNVNLSVGENDMCKSGALPGVEVVNEKLYVTSVTQNNNEKKQVTTKKPNVLDTGPPYNCDICDKEFHKASYLYRHLRKHTGEFTCVSCFMVFARKESLLNHSCYANANAKTFPCNVCCKKFTLKKMLKRHMAKHNGTYKCKNCQHSYSSQTTLQAHTCRASATKQPSRCTICLREFMFPINLKRHMQQHRNLYPCKLCGRTILANASQHEGYCSQDNFIKNGEEGVCPECNDKFCDVVEFRLHVYQQHSHCHICNTCSAAFRTEKCKNTHQCKEIIEKCQYCSEEFHSLLELEKHLINHGVPEFHCFDCGRSYQTADTLIGHTCDGVDVRAFFEKKKRCKKKTPHSNTDGDSSTANKKSNSPSLVCELCGEIYRTHGSLSVHKQMHGERRFECEICHKKFHRKDIMQEHLAVHQEPQIPCPVCQKKVKTRKSLDVHMKQHLGTRPFKCDECGREFFQKGNLQKHLQVHNNVGGKKLSCQHCDKKFTSQEYLVRHELEHTQGRIHACHICNKGFIKEHLLRHHIKTFHSGQLFECSFCPAKLKHRQSMQRHLERHHEKRRNDWSAPNFIDSTATPIHESVEIQNEGAEILLTISEMPLDQDIPCDIQTTVEGEPVTMQTEEVPVPMGNAFILEDGTIIQEDESDCGNIVFYVLDSSDIQTDSQF